ncbi:hypothetical protein K449DRAFT_387513 [Hypoxylon sp. EC38]|nr:hypothetical protein K449DRAFT_387513 [Hypoxylon sp. EC38]
MTNQIMCLSFLKRSFALILLGAASSISVLSEKHCAVRLVACLRRSYCFLVR